MDNSSYSKKKTIGGIKLNIQNHLLENRNWYLFQGIVFITAGMLAIALPSATAYGFGIVIGLLIILSGSIQLIASLKSKSHWWSIISALLSLTAGFLIIFHPVIGAIAITTLLAIFLAIEGLVEIFFAIELRSVKNWKWLFFSGLISLLFSFIIFAGWPESSLAFLGFLIGINLFLYGVSLVAITK